MASHLLPQGAYDTHVHVFDKQLGPYHPSRSYTPGEAPVQDLLDFESCISLTGKPSNIVIVQASPYRNDNRVVLAALQKLRDAGVESARGIAVFDPATITDDELDEMHRLGVRGLRLNVQADGGRPNLEAFQNALISSAERIKGLPNWKLQVYAPAEIWDALYETISSLPVQVIADHLGGLKGSSKLRRGAQDPNSFQNDEDYFDQPGFKSLLQLAQSSRVIVKLSGFYRASAESSNNYQDLAPLVRQLASQVRDQLLWGSDWPHTGEGGSRDHATALTQIEPFRDIDNEGILENLKGWIGDEDTWHKIMVDNPARLFE